MKTEARDAARILRHEGASIRKSNNGWCGAIERQSLGGRHRAHVAPTRRARAPVWSGRLGGAAVNANAHASAARVAGRRAPPGPHGGTGHTSAVACSIGAKGRRAVRLSSSRTLTSLLSASLSIFYDCTSTSRTRRCGSIATCSPTTPQTGADRTSLARCTPTAGGIATRLYGQPLLQVLAKETDELASVRHGDTGGPTARGSCKRFTVRYRSRDFDRPGWLG